ncbi:actin 2 [Pelomyxa schiedti]|nr:actin 2 [Pelomyxa schiedti]
MTYVVDFGTETTKAGFNVDANDPPGLLTEPSFVFPTVVGDLRCMIFGGGKRPVGDEAANNRRTYNLIHPVERGLINNWDFMHLVLNYTFFNVASGSITSNPLLIAETPLSPANIRENLITRVFETYHFPGAYFANQAVLSLYPSGRTTGLAIESGHGVTSVVPVYEGCAIPHSSTRLDLAGSDISECLRLMLNARGWNYQTAEEGDTPTHVSPGPTDLRNFKETRCYVSAAFDSEMESTSSKRLFELPDGREITNEHFRCAEALFRPSCILSPRHPTSKSQQPDGIHRACVESILRSHPDLHKQLLNNVVLGGANSLLPGLAPRLSAELHSLITSHQQPPSSTTSTSTATSSPVAETAPHIEYEEIQVSGPCTATSTPTQKKYSAWTGGSILASLGDFNVRLISSEEYYEEGGARLVHRMCY